MSWKLIKDPNGPFTIPKPPSIPKPSRAPQPPKPSKPLAPPGYKYTWRAK